MELLNSDHLPHANDFELCTRTRAFIFIGKCSGSYCLKQLRVVKLGLLIEEVYIPCGYLTGPRPVCRILSF